MMASTASHHAYAHDGNGNGWSQNTGTPHEHHPMSAAKIELLKKTMMKLHEDNKALHEEMHKLHQQLHDVIKADSFDQGRFMDISAQIDQLRDKAERNRTQAFASIAGEFTPQERHHIMKMFEHHGHGKIWHHHGHHMNDEHPAQNMGGNPGEWHHENMQAPNNQTQMMPSPQPAPQDYPPHTKR